ncbi:hypothetical protein AVEN_186130-1 [Araneus ventricosus]|uniref:Uncharacterized protein n=1 Tax=Araneus ventricosus TaxID=182803 RepID=A0A4Y2WY96_ARAVE|nr:hypothetical protein AVEN_186130-1 [Araneus ventricosus]
MTLDFKKRNAPSSTEIKADINHHDQHLGDWKWLLSLNQGDPIHLAKRNSEIPASSGAKSSSPILIRMAWVHPRKSERIKYSLENSFHQTLSLTTIDTSPKLTEQSVFPLNREMHNTQNLTSPLKFKL